MAYAFGREVLLSAYLFEHEICHRPSNPPENWRGKSAHYGARRRWDQPHQTFHKLSHYAIIGTPALGRLLLQRRQLRLGPRLAPRPARLQPPGLADGVHRRARLGRGAV